MNLTLTNDEARNLVALIDLALKHPQAGGVAVVVPAVALLRKVEEAQREALKKQNQESPE